MLFTIQSKSLPYIALAMASLVLTASSTVLFLVIISPFVTTLFDVRASVRSAGSIPKSSDTMLVVGGKGEEISGEGKGKVPLKASWKEIKIE